MINSLLTRWNYLLTSCQTYFTHWKKNQAQEYRMDSTWPGEADEIDQDQTSDVWQDTKQPSQPSGIVHEWNNTILLGN
ncbi:hypothetical protein GO755_23550 [Spirosoma sp. HMF4905]|uniref:Uncharacterized protein n=1 Tax=Spirosoma arboris TaxID=2682092 RepID=A0A7K1SHG1_9BACT|nr:hypothetical protein [Spirosoma arboris]MVM33036.1 hypothetical protein [Spirosoma arboris]